MCVLCKICQIPIRPKNKWPNLTSLLFCRERLFAFLFHSMLCSMDHFYQEYNLHLEELVFFKGEKKKSPFLWDLNSSFVTYSTTWTKNWGFLLILNTDCWVFLVTCSLGIHFLCCFSTAFCVKADGVFLPIAKQHLLKDYQSMFWLFSPSVAFFLHYQLSIGKQAFKKCFYHHHPDYSMLRCLLQNCPEHQWFNFALTPVEQNTYLTFLHPT